MLDVTIMGTGWAASWLALFDQAPRIAAYGALAMAAMLLFAIVLTILIPPPGYAAETVGVGSGSAVGPRDRGPRERRGRGAGLSPADLVALEALRRRIRAGEVNEGPIRPGRPATPC